MHPVGPSSPTTYWFRRVLVVVVAVAVLVTIVWYLANRTSRSSAGQDAGAAAVITSAAPTMTGVLANSTAPSRSTVPSTSPSPAAPTSASGSSGATAPTPGSTASGASSPAGTGASAPPSSTAPPPAPSTTAPPPPPPPSYDADGKLLCPDASVGLQAQVPAEVKSGTNVIIGMVVTNTGSQPCRRDVSGAQQVFTVFGADGTRLWSTADCFPGQGTDVRELAPGQTLKYTVKWSGTTSTPGCTGERAPLGAGSYTLIAQIGGLSSPPAAFTVG